MNGRPPNVVNARAVPEQELGKGRIFARDANLGRAAGSVNVGLVLQTVPPGKQSAPEHYHMVEEEIFYVLGGRGTLLQDGEPVPVEEGDVISFPAGTKVSHAFVADREEELRFLAFGQRSSDEVAVQPRSGKVLVRSLGFGGYLGEEADYFDGEPV